LANERTLVSYEVKNEDSIHCVINAQQPQQPQQQPQQQQQQQQPNIIPGGTVGPGGLGAFGQPQ